MKKLLCLLLVLCILFCVGCASTQGGDRTTSDPNGGETSGDFEPYTPEWHLSETVDEELLLSDASTDIGIRVPLVYEKTVSDVAFRFEFFEEFYPIGSMMQVRISVTNNTTEDIVYQANTESMLGLLYKEADETDELLRAPRFLQVREPNGESFTYYTDDQKPRNFHAGETLVFERAVRVSPDFFSKGETYSYIFAMIDITSDMRFYNVEIPISVEDR